MENVILDFHFPHSIFSFQFGQGSVMILASCLHPQQPKI